MCAVMIRAAMNGDFIIRVSIRQGGKLSACCYVFAGASLLRRHKQEHTL